MVPYTSNKLFFQKWQKDLAKFCISKKFRKYIDLKRVKSLSWNYSRNLKNPSVFRRVNIVDFLYRKRLQETLRVFH